MTSETRTEVAERMRGPFDVCECLGHTYINGTLFGMQVGARDEMELRNGMRDLADLIDPTCHLLPSPDGGSEKVEQPIMRRKVTGNLVFAENGGKVLSFLLDEDMAERIAKAVCDTSALSDSTLPAKDMRMWLEYLSGTSVKAIACGNALSEQAVRGAIKRVDRGRYAGEEIDL